MDHCTQCPPLVYYQSSLYLFLTEGGRKKTGSLFSVELYNAAYLKIAVGKGYITWNDILEMIEIYFNAEVDPIH